MNEDPIDQRLRAALRYAPDGDVAPSTALDQRIKAAARQALATRRSTWRGWLDQLLQPPAAAALATLVLGTVIGVMWQGRVPPESIPGAPSASADLPAVVVRTEPQASGPLPPQASGSLPPQASAPLPPQASAPVSPQASPKPAAPVAPAPAPAPAPPPAQAPAAVAKSARTMAENEVAALISPPAPAPSSEPAEAAAPSRPAAQAPTAARLRSESRTTADSTRAPDRLAAAAASAAAPEPPPFAELANAAAGPWQRVASNQMPDGGTFVRDANGLVLGRRLVDYDWLWWQPWIDGQPAPQAQRAPARGAASAPQR